MCSECSKTVAPCLNFTRYPAIDCPTIDFTHSSISPLTDCSSPDPPLSCCSFALFDTSPPRLLSFYRSFTIPRYSNPTREHFTKPQHNPNASPAIHNITRREEGKGRKATGAPNRHCISFQHHSLQHPNHCPKEPLLQAASRRLVHRYICNINPR